MINPEELMIGNYVDLLTPAKLSSGVYIKISEVRAGSVIERTIKETREFSIHEITPIIITPELLDRLGLITTDWFCYGSYQIVQDENYGWSMKVRNANHTKSIEFTYYKYVHQIQNLYYILTGQQLKFKE